MSLRGWWLQRNGGVCEQTSFDGVKEVVGAAGVRVGSGFNSPEGRMKALLFQ